MSTMNSVRTSPDQDVDSYPLHDVQHGQDGKTVSNSRRHKGEEHHVVGGKILL